MFLVGGERLGGSAYLLEPDFLLEPNFLREPDFLLEPDLVFITV